MERIEARARVRRVRWGVGGLALVLALGILGSRGGVAAPSRAAADITPDGGSQVFEDVPLSNPFYSYTNNIFADGIASGYPCGGAGEPCVAPNNRPYFRPNNNVTRGQMSKFLDLGRRNIAEAIGRSLTLTNTDVAALTISTTQGSALVARGVGPNGSVITGQCTRDNQNCRAVQAQAASGDYAASFSGGRGSHADSTDAGYPGMEMTASGSGAYAADIRGQGYRGAYVNTSNQNVLSLYVDAPISTPTSGTFAAFNTSVRIEGNLLVFGSKVGYVVDLMQNADSTALEPGDVVTISGDSAPVIGQIPVITVRKASQAYDTGVVGVVDQAMYVPPPALRTAYLAQEQARRTALAQRAQAEAAAAAQGVAPDLTGSVVPPATISDREGNVDVDPTTSQVVPDGYASVVTLGSYKGIKVDASFGAIQVGDLLVSSPHPGYAMKADEARIKVGTVIGKALRPLCVALASRFGEGFTERARSLAVAVELVHSATLLHDDVVDLAERRRGQPTACVTYGNAASIFAGDWLLVAALRRIRQSGVEGVLDRMLTVIDEMIVAESVQLERRGKITGAREDYFAIVEGKTAALFRWAMIAGARAAELPVASETALERFGLHLGVAFQAVDDELDYLTTNTGKDALADLREGKVTYPLVIALERVPGLRDELSTLLAQDEVSSDALGKIASTVRASGALGATRSLAEEHVQRALSVLEELPAGPARDALVTVALASLERQS